MASGGPEKANRGYRALIVGLWLLVSRGMLRAGFFTSAGVQG